MSKNFYADGRESVDTQRMTEAVFEANRQIAREKFDYKSGFVEWGKIYVCMYQCQILSIQTHRAHTHSHIFNASEVWEHEPDPPA